MASEAILSDNLTPSLCVVTFLSRVVFHTLDGQPSKLLWWCVFLVSVPSGCDQQVSERLIKPLVSGRKQVFFALRFSPHSIVPNLCSVSAEAPGDRQRRQPNGPQLHGSLQTAKCVRVFVCQCVSSNKS